ncbi:MAG: phosphate ABC transporter permease PstA [Candidatus Cloacimonetes bacterium]|jgi:phosphate transport system permease protein|nr:phosphate ABC transporter permease PstA [Candidatus Cloacimonadota bacterium]MDD2507137.1 phosphate ABC transporter permease PstA [Candidatus Cloacimonadota bacterium]MDD4148061.1 phosphate ABC transporter permease PstA [Candidatus Cloacimonadota bacterium]MDD4560654.1 phosphate ABC transporter permease PstA [Candidatus Cloacimonadota bacterium]
MKLRYLANISGKLLMALLFIITALMLFIFLGSIFSRGIGVISWSFISETPRSGMTEGGIFPAIVGTFWLTLLSILIALPLGIFCAIYLFCYGKPMWFVNMVRLAINTLAGVPSIIYGLFGMAVFVNMFSLDVSLISGALTLSVLALPLIINTTEEALQSVPADFTEASIALGAQKSTTIIRVVLPSALPNILTGVIISIGRVAGETAPIMFTAATFYSRKLPNSLSDEVMALPYHIFALVTEGSKATQQVPIAYGSALVLLFLVLGVSSIAIAIRYHMRRNKQW